MSGDTLKRDEALDVLETDHGDADGALRVAARSILEDRASRSPWQLTEGLADEYLKKAEGNPNEAYDLFDYDNTKAVVDALSQRIESSPYHFHGNRAAKAVAQMFSNGAIGAQELLNQHGWNVDQAFDSFDIAHGSYARAGAKRTRIILGRNPHLQHIEGRATGLRP